MGGAAGLARGVGRGGKSPAARYVSETLAHERTRFLFRVFPAFSVLDGEETAAPLLAQEAGGLAVAPSDAVQLLDSHDRHSDGPAGPAGAADFFRLVMGRWGG